MRGWRLIVLGLVVLALGYWLMGPLWRVDLAPRDASLPGHGPADWLQPITPDVIRLATAGVAATLASGLIFIWAWRGAPSGTGAVKIARGISIFVLTLAVASAALPGLLIASHELHWTHDELDLITLVIAMACLGGLGVYALTGLILQRTGG